jgi:hypothetical protein
MTATASPVADVVWSTAPAICVCSECAEYILPGNRMAIYDEVLAPDVLTGEKKIIERVYCEDCGHLLEDSLTTTETLP